LGPSPTSTLLGLAVTVRDWCSSSDQVGPLEQGANAENALTMLLLMALIQAAALSLQGRLPTRWSVNAERPQIAGRAFEHGRIRGSSAGGFRFGHADYRTTD